jgi:hypothetical protein
MATTKTKYRLEIQAPANGKVGKSVVTVLDAGGKVVTTDKGDLQSAAEREKVAKRLAKRLGLAPEAVRGQLETAWNEAQDRYRQFREQAEAGSPEAAAVETVRLLDAAPATLRRPLSLAGGTSYAAAWLTQERTTSRSIDRDTGAAVEHHPPRVSTEEVLLVVARDGRCFAESGVAGARPPAELGLEVRLPAAPPPGRGWSGAGVKRYLGGERPDPAEVFGRVAEVVDRFLDFDRSLAGQPVMCELAACYVLASYLLDAFNVVGYLWPNGESGAGKTTLLQVVTETAYLGQLILAGSSYPTLRDLADYGATLAFDDAEAVMDVRRADPDKRTLLLAGNRRGAAVAVKELEPDGQRWATRYVDAFCPRLFSAIKLPDEVLGSRSIIVPLVRSGDEKRAKANPMDPEDWPCDRRRLVDDLWAVGLRHLPELAAFDRRAAAAAALSGRNLDPWRPILAVALWLQEAHAEDGLYDRMEQLSRDYQEHERGEYEQGDQTRVLFRALLAQAGGLDPAATVTISPKDVAAAMNGIAADENLTDGDKPYTTARRVGWLLKRQRFRRPQARSVRGKQWESTAAEITRWARAYGVRADDEAAEPAGNEAGEPADDEAGEPPF